MRNLRHARHAVTREMFLSRKAGTWSDAKKVTTLSKHKQKQSTTSLKPIFTYPENSPTQREIRNFCSQYKLIKLTPKTTPLAKQTIIKQLATSPVAVDVSNYKELTRAKANILYERHSFVISRYHPTRDTFTIRSSTTGDGKQVDANALARGTYQIYFLQKK
jgi:hypothetical protein